MKILALEVPDSFLVGKPFELEPAEITAFLSPYRGHIEDTGEVSLERPDIEKTIKAHSGDNRLWYTDGYNTFSPKTVFMEVKFNEYYDDIFDFIKARIPSMYNKYFEV